jgi:hypothetical protein
VCCEYLTLLWAYSKTKKFLLFARIDHASALCLPFLIPFYLLQVPQSHCPMHCCHCLQANLKHQTMLLQQVLSLRWGFCTDTTKMLPPLTAPCNSRRALRRQLVAGFLGTPARVLNPKDDREAGHVGRSHVNLKNQQQLALQRQLRQFGHF